MASQFSVPLANGVLFPLLGIGTWQLKGENLVTAIHSILKHSEYGLIDTATIYENEQEIGDYLASISETERKKLFITSKLWRDDGRGTEAAYNACLKSMESLQIKILDLYLIHWPFSTDLPESSPLNRKRRLDNWRGLERLYKEGKVRAIGVSNFRIRHLQELIDDGAEIIPMVNQIEIHPLCYEEGFFDFCEKHKIRVQAYGSLAAGSAQLLEHPVVQTICQETQLPPVLVLLRWAIQHGFHVIPSSKSPQHIADNTKIFKISLSSSQMERLDSMKTGKDLHIYVDPTDVA